MGIVERFEGNEGNQTQAQSGVVSHNSQPGAPVSPASPGASPGTRFKASGARSQISSVVDSDSPSLNVIIICDFLVIPKENQRVIDECTGY
jgi:hypothetical protein